MTLRALAVGVAAMLVASGVPSPISADERPPHVAELPTPALVERDVDRGVLGREDADRILIAALRGEGLPDAYASDTPFHGTLTLLDLHRRLDTLAPGPHRRYLHEQLHPGPLGTDQCDLSRAPLPNTIESPHFYIEYNALLLTGGLTVEDYIAALEGAWSKEVDQFGWAAPPVYRPNPAPNNKYPVRIDTLGPALYGFASNVGTHAGRVGNNPVTEWNEGDADASCMVLNARFDTFPGSPPAALEATAAHEFNHSIQFGWGVLGGGRPDGVFVEGGATWMEDEVYDGANDSYNYLWPTFEDDMGEYQGDATRSPYDYWITWRGMTERYGSGVPGGAEDVMQRFWELTSRNRSEGMDALDRALEARGSSVATAYHDYAIAVKFTKPCGGGYQPPHCLEEGPGYVAARGATVSHGAVSMNGAFQGRIPDHYSLNWIDLPQNTVLQTALRNTSDGGRFRASLACDTGTGLVIIPFSAVAGGGETVYIRSYDPAGCPTPIVVVTNLTHTEANPPGSALRSYTLSVGPPAGPSSLSIRARVARERLVAAGRLSPSGRGKVTVRLFERHGRWRHARTRTARVRAGGRYRVKFAVPDTRRCRLVAEFDGDLARLPTRATRTFAC